MADSVYLISEGSNLIQLNETQFESEDLLQQMIASHPDLMAGHQINPSNPRKWILVSREIRIPGEEDGSGRWSLDHLFLDQDGIPTLVEVKRGKDTRIRREVVGQMLDYAANAVVYWPPGTLREHYESRFNEHDESQIGLYELLNTESDQRVDEFWESVEYNLKIAKIRMVFLADSIPNELRRIVEFLNEQMNPAEILAVELKRFENNSIQTLVPRVYGQTAESQRKKSNSSKSPSESITRDQFIGEALDSWGSDMAGKLNYIIDWFETRHFSGKYTKGVTVFSYIPTINAGDRKFYPFSLRSNYGCLQLYMTKLSDTEPFNNGRTLAELQTYFEKIPGFKMRGSGMKGLPYVDLHDDSCVEPLICAVDWMIAQLMRAHS